MDKKQHAIKISNRTPELMANLVLIHEVYNEELSTKRRKALKNKHYISSDFWHLVCKAS